MWGCVIKGNSGHLDSGVGKVKVLWLTNLAAPYRVPLWATLGKRYNLTVALLESSRSLAADTGANRGPDWQLRETDAVRYVEIPTTKLKRGEARYYFLRNLRPLTKLREYDVVIFGGWESPAYWAFLAAATVFGAGRVGFYESTLSTMKNTKGPIAWIRWAFFTTMHAVVVPGRAAHDALLHIGLSDRKIVEGFNAVDVEAFHKASKDITAAPAKGHSFLYVGQLIQRKRVDAIIDAFCAIASTDDRLCIVGSGDQANYLSAKAHAWGPSISFVPHVDNGLLPDLMARHQTLVLASSEEVWGLVVNEALATGLHAVVSENCGVVPSVLGMDGVFVTRTDLRDLQSQMLASRRHWKGGVKKPQILTYTPEKFASTFERAIDMAR